MSGLNILKFISFLTKSQTPGKLKKITLKYLPQFFPIQKIQFFDVIRLRSKIKNQKDQKYSIIENLGAKQKNMNVSSKSVMYTAIKQNRNMVTKEKNKIQIIFPIAVQSEIIHIFFLEVANTPKHKLEKLLLLMEIIGNHFQLLEEKFRDILTGIHNRQALNNVLQTIFLTEPKKLEGTKPNQISLAIIDIDFFKKINDTFGHMVGDEILILFSYIIKSSLRFYDKVFRYGGEEFVVILDGVGKKFAYLILERLRIIIEKYDFPQVKSLTISIGFTELFVNHSSLTILDQADRALYYSKETGRNKVSNYEDLLANNLIESVAKEQEIDFW